MTDVRALPEALLPELRAKWIKLAGTREVAKLVADHLQQLEGDYQQTLNVCMRFLDLDPGKNWRVDLETGEIVEAEDQGQTVTAGGNGTPAPAAVQP